MEVHTSNPYTQEAELLLRAVRQIRQTETDRWLRATVGKGLHTPCSPMKLARRP